MKTVEEWFQEYGASHQNRTNKLIHWFCVPMITFCAIGLLWGLNTWAAIAFMAVAFVFYLRLSVPLSLAMAALVGLMFLVILALQGQGNSVLLSTTFVLFVISWILQFVGHHIEGKKPSFLKDIQFLLIGPVMGAGFSFQEAEYPLLSWTVVLMPA